MTNSHEILPHKPYERNTYIAVNPSHIRKQLKQAKLSTSVLAALAGYTAEPSIINYWLRENKLPTNVVELLDELGVSVTV